MSGRALCVGLIAVCLAVGVAAAPGPSMAAGRTWRVPVLMYHRIAAWPDPWSAYPGLVVRPAELEAQLAALERRGWRTITAAQLGAAVRARRPASPRTFVITFDDGRADGYANAWPILRRHGFTATFYVVVGRIGKPRYLSWGQAAELVRAGNEVASHTEGHISVHAIGAPGLRRQIDRAAALIAARAPPCRFQSAVEVVALAGGPVRRVVTRPCPRLAPTFAYPYGKVSGDAVRFLARRGYSLAVTTLPGIGSVASSPALRYPRVRVERGESLTAFLQSMNA